MFYLILSRCLFDTTQKSTPTSATHPRYCKMDFYIWVCAHTYARLCFRFDQPQFTYIQTQTLSSKALLCTHKINTSVVYHSNPYTVSVNALLYLQSLRALKIEWTGREYKRNSNHIIIFAFSETEWNLELLNQFGFI